ncbi:myosin-9 [Nothobranchius furzeri]
MVTLNVNEKKTTKKSKEVHVTIRPGFTSVKSLFPLPPPRSPLSLLVVPMLSSLTSVSAPQGRQLAAGNSCCSSLPVSQEEKEKEIQKEERSYGRGCVTTAYCTCLCVQECAAAVFAGSCRRLTALEDGVRHSNCEVRAHEEEVRGIKHLEEQKDEEQQQLQNQQPVKAFEEELKKQTVEMDLLHQQLKRAKDQLKCARLKPLVQEEMAAIFKQKYTTAMEKVHMLQGYVEHLEVELQCSQKKQRELQSAVYLLSKELSELQQQYEEKVSQWESSQEAFDQLMDELQTSQTALRDSQQKVDQCRKLHETLQDHTRRLEQQNLILEQRCCLHQQIHPQSEEEHLSLLKLRQELRKGATEPAERLANCQKAILEIKSKLAQKIQEKDDQSGAASHPYLSKCRRLELEVHLLLLGQVEEQLEGMKYESERRCIELNVQRGEVQRLREELRNKEEKTRSTMTENRRLRRTLEELCNKHRVTVEELAARADEARRMEGHLKEGKLSEEKIRSLAEKLEKDMVEYQRRLQETVDEKIRADREKQEAQEQISKLHSELVRAQSSNANLHQESRLVLRNVHLWITEQRTSCEILLTQMKAQNQKLLIDAAEITHLREANDTLKAEMGKLKQALDEKERDPECFQAQIRDRSMGEDGRKMSSHRIGKKSCVARNLNKIEDVHSRLQSNQEAIGMLNQQLYTLCREHRRLHQLYDRAQTTRATSTHPPPLLS